MTKRKARKALHKYFHHSLEPRFCDVDHLLKWLRRRGFKVTRR